MRWFEIGFAAIFGGLIGGGAIAGLFYRGLKDRLIEDLRTIFAKRSDLNEINVRLEELSNLAKISAANSEAIVRLQESGKPIALLLERVHDRLDDMDKRQRASDEQMVRVVTILNELEKRMDRHERSTPH